MNKERPKNYRDRLTEDFDADIGSVVGCGLDRLERPVSAAEIQRAVDYYQANRDELSKLPIGARRDTICGLLQVDRRTPRAACPRFDGRRACAARTPTISSPALS